MADEETKADRPEQAEQQAATDWEARYRAAVERPGSLDAGATALAEQRAVRGRLR